MDHTPRWRPEDATPRPPSPARTTTAVGEVEPSTTPVQAVDIAKQETWRMPALRIVMARTMVRRPALKVASTALMLVLLVLVDLVVQVDRRTWDIRSDPVDNLARIQACESLGRSPDILYTGSSVSLRNIDPIMVDSLVKTQTGQTTLGCNIGASASTFEEDYYALKRMIEDGYTPKVVVESIWEGNVLPSENGPHPSYLMAKAQVPWLADVSDVSALRTRSQTRISSPGDTLDFLASKTIALYGDRNGLHDWAAYEVCALAHLKACTAPTGVTSDMINLHGWGPLTGKNIVTKPPKVPACAAPCAPISLVTNGELAPYLDKLIQLAHQHHAAVVLISPPVTQYRISIYGEANWQNFQNYWQQVATRDGATFYNLNALPIFTPYDFFDDFHLDIQGAEKYSQWLAPNVVEPALASQQSGAA